jgi:hypothetical protein
MHPKLEKALPLLEHWYAKGKFNLNGKTVMPWEEIHLLTLLERPERYTIHREPRVVYVNHYTDGDVCAHLSEELAKKWSNTGGQSNMSRYVEDLNWKPS